MNITTNTGLFSNFGCESCCNIRPCQAVSLGGVVTSVALIALGMATGGIPGFLALGVGVGLGYLSYNSFQVFTNLHRLDTYDERSSLGPIARATNDFLASAHSALNGTPHQFTTAQNHPFYGYVGNNTLFFDWAIHRIVNNGLTRESAREILHKVDNFILNPCKIPEELVMNL